MIRDKAALKMKETQPTSGREKNAASCFAVKCHSCPCFATRNQQMENERLVRSQSALFQSNGQVYEYRTHRPNTTPYYYPYSGSHLGNPAYHFCRLTPNGYSYNNYSTSANTRQVNLSDYPASRLMQQLSICGAAPPRPSSPCAAPPRASPPCAAPCCGPCCCGGNCLPPPCNSPPKCIQYMTGYYYYPYGFWFCGPYHVTGTCVPGGPVCPGGPCGPGCPCPGGPCGPCGPGCVCGLLDPTAIGGVSSNRADTHLDNIKSPLHILTGVKSPADLLSKVKLPDNLLCCIMPTSSDSGPCCGPGGCPLVAPCGGPCCGPCCGGCGCGCGCGPSCCGPCIGGCGCCGPCGPKGPFGPCGPCFPGVGCGCGGFGPCCSCNMCKVGPGCCCGSCCGGPCVCCGPAGCGGCCGGCCGCCGCGPWCGPCCSCACAPLSVPLPPGPDAQRNVKLPKICLPDLGNNPIDPGCVISMYRGPKKSDDKSDDSGRTKGVPQSSRPDMNYTYPYSRPNDHHYQRRAMPLNNTTPCSYYYTAAGLSGLSSKSFDAAHGEAPTAVIPAKKTSSVSRYHLIRKHHKQCHHRMHHNGASDANCACCSKVPTWKDVTGISGSNQRQASISKLRRPVFNIGA